MLHKIVMEMTLSSFHKIEKEMTLSSFHKIDMEMTLSSFKLVTSRRRVCRTGQHYAAPHRPALHKNAENVKFNVRKTWVYHCIIIGECKATLVIGADITAPDDCLSILLFLKG